MIHGVIMLILLLDSNRTNLEGVPNTDRRFEVRHLHVIQFVVDYSALSSDKASHIYLQTVIIG